MGFARAGLCRSRVPRAGCRTLMDIPRNFWHHAFLMARPASEKRRPADINRLAHSIAVDATVESAFDGIDVCAAQQETVEHPSTERSAHEAAVVLGRLGGLKGGKARAAVLSKKKRTEI